MSGELIFWLTMALVVIIVIISVVISLVITFVSIAAPLGLTGWWFKKMRDQEAQTRALLTRGEPAEAAILNMWDTGVTINGNPRVGLLLEVRPANRAAFQVETTRTISRLQTAMFLPGTVIRVRYDSNDPTKVAIEQVEMPGGSAATSGKDKLTPQSLACPSCGAPLDYHGSAGSTSSCPYCGASVIVPGD
jgi:hypothetical protein